MNGQILLGFRNEKALLNERILSGHEFPVEILSEEQTHLSAALTCGDNKKIFENYLLALADYMICRYEKKLLSRMIQKKEEGIKSFQVQDILAHLSMIDDDAFLGREARKKAIYKSLYQYFKEHQFAHIEGLVTFRLQEYQSMLMDVAEKLLEMYFVQKEYEEFVSLLRYFVNVQNGRPPLSHLVVHIDGVYSLLDEEGIDITAECLSDFVRPEEVGKENADDLLISILITLAPEKIIVHGGQNIKNAELFRTIDKVFDKVEYCTKCAMCEQRADIKK